jgi:PKD domain/Right handed beta helix region
MNPISFFRSRQIAIQVFLVAAFMQANSFIGLAEAVDFKVSSADELQAALAKVQGGDKIIVAAGNYGVLIIGNQGAFRFADTVEITAADPTHKPVFSHLEILNASHLKLTGLMVDYSYAPNDPPQFEAAKISSSEHISILNCVFDGDMASGTGTFADGFATGIGLRVKNSKSIVLDHTVFRQWLRGATFRIVEDLEVNGNEISEIRSDGLDFAQITNAVIKDNHIHDFRMAPGSPDHRDMIQFWTKETTAPSSNIIIQNNFLDMGTGSPTQSIFMRNEVVDQNNAGPEMFYQNIRIEGNLIRNAHINAIAIGETNGLSIERNTLLQAVSIQKGGKVSVPALSVAVKSVGVSVAGNLVPRMGQMFKSPPPDWKVSNNVSLQRVNPDADDYYGNIFVDALSEKTLELADLAIIPTSAFAEQSLGSPMSTFNVAPKRLIGIVSSKRGSGSVLSQDITLSQAYGPEGPLQLKSEKISWTFGDGQTGFGKSLNHQYAAAGIYVVRCVVQLPDQTTFKCEQTIAVGY